MDLRLAPPVLRPVVLALVIPTLAKASSATCILFNQPLIVTPDEKHSAREQRIRALGMTNTGRLLTMIFTLRAEGELVRVISARDMHRKERKEYEQTT